jgi:hypothetical protein
MTMAQHARLIDVGSGEVPKRVGQGEVSLLRRLRDVLRPGDVLLAGSLLANSVDWRTYKVVA